jgi:hypothetical protein
MNLQTEKAIESVREANMTYYLNAYGFAKEWTQLQMKPFSSEDLKDAFYKISDKPSEPRVWGAVMVALSKDRLIIHHGFQKYKNPVGHSKPSTVWISKRYSEKQSANRKANSQTQTTLFL